MHPEHKHSLSDLEEFYIQTIKLNQFRNYANCQLELENQPVVITGENGAGKTNLIEALSLSVPGKGLRKTKLRDLSLHAADESSPWSVYLEFRRGFETIQFGSSLEVKQSDKRVVKVDQETVDQKSLNHYFSLFWITPEHDRIFVGTKADRRAFFDQLVNNFQPDHLTQISAYEKLVRQRLKLLYNPYHDVLWLSTIEKQIAELTVSISYSRMHVTELIMKQKAFFPFVDARVEQRCECQDYLQNHTAIQTENFVQESLEKNRNMDKESGMTHFGPHRSDWQLYFFSKSLPASHCSMGEQKLLLVWVMLCAIHAYSLQHHQKALFLIDEVTAHLDQTFKEGLFEMLLDLKIQFWLTGTDPELFNTLNGSAQFLNVTSGRVKKIDG